MRCFLGFVLALTFAACVFADEKTEAAKVANSFFEGLKIKDIPEGQKVIVAKSWGGLFSQLAIRDLPVYTEAKTLYEGMFPTDNRGVQGFKRLIEMKAVSQGPSQVDLLLNRPVPPKGQTSIKRYLLIAYKQKPSGPWRVLELRETVDTAEEVAAARRDLSSSKPPDPKYKQRRLGYFLILDGKFAEARAAFEASAKMNSTSDKEDISVNLKEHISFVDAVVGTKAVRDRETSK